ncbi:DsbA family protein [Pelagibacterium xiamenense]|uniref:DsbA family protein n=1 Tax=Pelagibacterium xiamenense TaxID=2901140 RepID=UPI001E5CE376|nr:DsbA family protein [Pelagibacterium xiamenense]MCD7061113.1 DsbA family protein [Pelagibacterium xiamenense]
MQKSLNLALTGAVAVLAAAVVGLFVTRPAPGPSPDDIRALVSEAVETRIAALERHQGDTMDTASLGTEIESYLLGNPGILEDMSLALETERRAAQAQEARVALARFEDQIYNDPANIVLGNPQGDVTLVEMFDYNCGYCRRVVADVLALVEEDPNLRVILKEFPILSEGSVAAARVGIMVNRQGGDYKAFHAALFSGRGTVDANAALAAAENIGLDASAIETGMNSGDVTAALQRSYQIAQGLGISGTPTFIIGDEIIPGAVDKAELTRRIANMRACGETVCNTDG